MEPDDGNTVRQSGLPRPSKLPVSATKGSHLPLPTRVEPSKSSNATGAAVNGQHNASTRRPTATELPRSRIGQAPSNLHGKPIPRTGNASIGLKQPLASANVSRLSGAKSLSNLRQPKPKIPPRQPSIDQENQDGLGSLNGFRSASRQSSYNDDFPEQSIPDVPILPTHDTGKRKASRPSLSDRTIESLQNVPTTPKDRRRSSFFSPPGSTMGPPPRPSSSMSRGGSNGNSRPGTSDGSFAPQVRGSTQSSTKRYPASAQPATRSFGFNARRSTSLASSAQMETTTRDIALPPLASPSPSKGRSVAARNVKSKPAAKPHSAESEQSTPSKPSSSSAALREQIAAARAARKQNPGSSHRQYNDNGDFGGDSDPFNQAPKDGKHILRNRINAARMDGRLNIAALGLKDVPEEVLKMYDASQMEESKVSWAEVVDLTRFMAADNEIEELGSNVFPDISADDISADDDAEGNQFGGLELLDLHGNKLGSLPLGLRRLERLTTLNLSHNKLDLDALDVISQIQHLKDLKLGHNELSGNLPSTLCDLRHLEVLDLRSNRLLGLPEALGELTSLKFLNVSGNQLTGLPIEALHHLVDLDASNNALISSLVPAGGLAAGFSNLHSLNVANNSLAVLSFDVVEFPRLQVLDVSNNHLTVLPDLSGWSELKTLLAVDNKMEQLPDGFTRLQKLRNVNLSGNNIRIIEPELARMEALESLILAANPLRDKKFLTMNAADIKRDLRERLTTTQNGDPDGGQNAQDKGPASGSPKSPTSTWAVQSNGRVDLSNKGHTDSVNDQLGSFLRSNTILHLSLASNKLTTLPPALWLGQDLRILDLSGNRLDADYLSDELELPALQELKLTQCNLSSLEPLTTNLIAPKLRSIDVSANRLNGDVTPLRLSYPSLTTLIANDNKFSAVSPAALQGLQVVNLAANDLQQLPAEIGLLWEEGMRSLEVGRNAFRVPNWRVLEKGTEAVMRWLRERIPAGAEVD